MFILYKIDTEGTKHLGSNMCRKCLINIIEQDSGYLKTDATVNHTKNTTEYKLPNATYLIIKLLFAESVQNDNSISRE